MNINRKYIIIFGTSILLLVIIAGGITYYKEKVAEIPISTPILIPEDKEYVIWCFEDGIRYDCSDRESFKTGESIAVSVNLNALDTRYESYFLCYYTDLLKTKLEKQCLSRSASLMGGFSLEGETINIKDKEVFTLLKLSVYPDDSFEELDEMVIMDLEGKLKNFTETLNN